MLGAVPEKLSGARRATTIATYICPDAASSHQNVRAISTWDTSWRSPRSIDAIDAKFLYEALYCARGDMENQIKEQQLDRRRTETARSRGSFVTPATAVSPHRDPRKPPCARPHPPRGQRLNRPSSTTSRERCGLATLGYADITPVTPRVHVSDGRSARARALVCVRPPRGHQPLDGGPGRGAAGRSRGSQIFFSALRGFVVALESLPAGATRRVRLA